jgi:hypothetical protein
MESISYMAFRYCTGLTSVSFPVATYIGIKAFQNCTSLTSVNLGSDIPSTGTATQGRIDAGAFSSCSKLINLTLCYPSVAALSDVTAFLSTPMSLSTLTGSFGSIYVPASLLTAYQSATNWTYFSSRFVGI